MRKGLLIIFAVSALFGFAACGSLTNKESTDEMKLPDCQLAYDKGDSYFNDYYIKDGKVYFECVYFLENPSEEIITCALTAGFSKDVGRLVKEKEICGYVVSIDNPSRFDINPYATDEMQTDEFQLPPGKHLIEVVFVGTALGENGKKSDRLLPTNLWFYQITEDGDRARGTVSVKGR